MRRLLSFVIVVIAAWSARAYAYPQFQLSLDQTCTSCHISPAGGELLSENGLVTAEAISQVGTDPRFLNALVTPPSWLALGGDFRGAAGLYAAPDKSWVLIPMQADVYANATFNAFSVHVTAGARDPQYDNTTATLFSSREHWVQWQQSVTDEGTLYLRAGRFMPVYGLRFAEHPDYDRRYGGAPLYGEAYGVAAEYVDPKYEVHATGFIHDPFFPDSVERGNGAALYAETRLTKTTSVGVEGKLDITSDDRHIYGGVTAKHFLPKQGILIEGELEVVHQKVDAGGTDNQIVATVVGSYFLGPLLFDLGVNEWSPDLQLRLLDQEAFDLNVHYFMTSHVELIAMNRLQMLDFGAGGLTSGYSLLMLHYRL